MREHKYKAYHKERKVIRDVVSINFEHELLYVRSDPREPYSHWIWQFEDIELMEYTGLRDKNYVEIYEGYILEGGYTNSMTGEFISKKYVVEYEEALNKCKLIGHTPFGDTWLKFIKAPEVIGNIYQDKHLLEG